MATIRTTPVESNVSVNTNSSVLTLNIYFSADNYLTHFSDTPLYCTCNGQTQSANVSHPQGGSVSVSFAFNIPHNSDGSKTVSWNWSCATGTSVLGTVTDSGTTTLTTINRTTTNSVTGTDIDGNFSVNYTKMTTGNYTYRLRISIPQVAFLEYINYETSDEVFTLSQETIESLYSRYTTTNSFDLGFAVETLSADGQTVISMGNEVIIKARITGANPLFYDFDFEDTNSNTIALTGDNTINVNGYSNIQITISSADKAIAQKGATMIKYRIIVGSQTLDVNYDDTNDIVATINNCTSGTYEVYAIDSRNNSTLITKFATSVKEYTPLVRNTNYSVERDDGGIGGNVTLSFSGTIWNDNFGSVSNTFDTAKYLFKKTDSSTWIDLGSSMTNITPTITNNTFSFTGLIRSNNADTTWDLNSSYDIKVILEDKLSSVEFETVLSSATPNISLSRNGVGIMCDYDETKGGLLQIGGEVYGNSWKLVDNKTGTSEITLPSNYNEIMIIVKSSDTARNWNFGVFPEQFVKGLTNNRAFRSGHYTNGGDYSDCAMWVKNTGKIQLADAKFNGIDVTNSSITYVYYR